MAASRRKATRAEAQTAPAAPPGARPAAATWRGAWAAPLLLAHLFLVLSVAAQPLGVNLAPEGYRSPIWPLHNDTVHRIGPASDFFAVYHAGAALRAGLDPFEPREDPVVTPYANPFRYLPLVGQTIGRLAVLLAPQTAYLFWLAVNELALAGLLAVLLRRLRTRASAALALVALLLGSPYLLELHMGQFTFVTLAALAAGLVLLSDAGAPAAPRASRAWGALAWGTAVALKVFPLATLPALWRVRAARGGVLVAAGLVVLVSAPYLLGHPEQARAFFAANFTHPRGGMDGGNVGLVYLLHRLTRDLWPVWHAGHWPALLAGWRWGLLLATTALVLWGGRADPLVGGAALLLAHFVSYAHVWEHHASGIVVVGLLLLLGLQRRSVDGRTGGLGVVAMLAVVALALPTPYALLDTARDVRVWDPTADWTPAARYLVVLSKAAPTAALFVCAVIAQLRRPHGESS